MAAGRKEAEWPEKIGDEARAGAAAGPGIPVGVEAVREYSICLDVRLEPSSYYEDLTCDLLDILLEDARALGPVTHADTSIPVVGARFNVQAEDAVQAMEEARTILTDALRGLGIQPPLEIVYAELEEYVEEEAACLEPV